MAERPGIAKGTGGGNEKASEGMDRMFNSPATLLGAMETEGRSRGSTCHRGGITNRSGRSTCRSRGSSARYEGSASRSRDISTPAS